MSQNRIWNQSGSRRGVLATLGTLLLSGAAAGASAVKKAANTLAPNRPDDQTQNHVLRVLVVCLNEQIRQQLLVTGYDVTKELLLKGVSQKEFDTAMDVIREPSAETAIESVRLIYARQMLVYSDGGCPSRTCLEMLLKPL